jgi:hypothetical protein
MICVKINGNKKQSSRAGGCSVAAAECVVRIIAAGALCIKQKLAEKEQCVD